MSTKLVVDEIRCPYCGMKVNDQAFELPIEVNRLPITRWRVILCETEGGGCDKRFAVQVEITATVTPYTMEQAG